MFLSRLKNVDPLGPEILWIESAPGFTAAADRSCFLHDDGNLVTRYVVNTADFKTTLKPRAPCWINRSEIGQATCLSTGISYGMMSRIWVLHPTLVHLSRRSGLGL